MTGTEMVPETLVSFDYLTRLIAPEDFIQLVAVKVPNHKLTWSAVSGRHRRVDMYFRPCDAHSSPGFVMLTIELNSGRMGHKSDV
jgi:hypothetical protein